MILNSIKKRKQMEILYPELEIIEPHAMGYTTAGNVAVRAWNTKKKGWRLYRIDKIKGYQTRKRKFKPRIREGYKRDDKGLQPLIVQV